MVFNTKTYKTQTKLFSTAVLIFVLAVSAILILFGSRSSFNKTMGNELEQLATMKKLDFEGKLNSQIALALQMAKSPVFKRFIEEAENESFKNEAIDEVAAYEESFLGHSSFWCADATKEFYSDRKFSYIIDPDKPSEYWYKMTLESEDDFNFNINYNPDLKVTNLWLNAVVRNADGKSIGVAGTGIPLDGFIEGVYEGMGEDRTMYLFNSANEITGALDKDLIESKTLITDAIQELKGRESELITMDIARIMTNSGIYVVKNLPSVNWRIIIFKPFTIRNLMFNSYTFVSTLLIAITAALLTIFNIFISRILKSMGAVIRTTHDEATKQKSIVSNVRRAVKANVNSIANFGELMSEQAATIEESEAHITELINQVQSLEKLRRNSTENTRNLEKSSQVGAEHIEELQEKIKKIEKCTERLDSANDLISSVTDQTALVAINAAIEAAHAGEMGAGFAVVAREIRQLAEKSKEHEEEVLNSIEEMNQMVKVMSEYSATVRDSFSNIVENSGKVGANFMEMSESIEQQATIGQTISSNLKAITESVEKTTSEFDFMKVENESVATDIEKVAGNSEVLLKSAEKALRKI